MEKTQAITRFFLVTLLLSNSTIGGTADSLMQSKDHHSYANPDEAQITHLDIDLSVDFSKKVLHGHIVISATKKHPNVSQIILDTRDLTIERITSLPENSPLNYQLGNRDKILGSALTISLPKTNLQKDIKIRIDYKTNPSASGLQWLSAAQTAEKKHPFLFSQSQAIHARSWLPTQDSPQIRTTYKATIHTQKDLLAVMSASNIPYTEKSGTYHFDMPQPIPAYLYAIAVGDIAFQAIGKQTGVYAEPSVLQASAEEFSHTQTMLEVCEKLYGPYRWGRYDLLVLPPSFPYGGMENPRLSFITPTVIAGDKSLVNIIAHELTHSWSGNLVTNASWRDLWLNEGFTTYVESRIMEAMYGKSRAEMENVLGYEALIRNMRRLDKADSSLTVDLKGRDPDETISDIPYVKGQLFLIFLEKRFGRKQFDQFLFKYFNDHAFQSINTEQFLQYLKVNLLTPHPNTVTASEINEWVYQTGLPETTIIPQSDAFSIVNSELQRWLAGKSSAKKLNTSNWVVHQWLFFLNQLPQTLSLSQLQELDSTFKLSSSKNNEIAHTWLLIAIKHNYHIAFGRLEQYLTEIGRLILVMPLYKALLKTDEGSKFASNVFEKAKPGYHPLTIAAFNRALAESKVK